MSVYLAFFSSLSFWSHLKYIPFFSVGIRHCNYLSSRRTLIRRPSRPTCNRQDRAEDLLDTLFKVCCIGKMRVGWSMRVGWGGRERGQMAAIRPMLADATALNWSENGIVAIADRRLSSEQIGYHYQVCSLEWYTSIWGSPVQAWRMHSYKLLG